ncbi:unnamed protein product [Paramecium pentaurelia]|uniref:Uncharacterized protein n=1 Tax=Paramecium pentaurelia TaxID=43138 RepID=A0A8S1WGQ9_9CILI|nr:unnamed protein product [Paramecium pentaurelia]
MRVLFNRSYIHQCRLESGGLMGKKLWCSNEKEGEEKLADKIRKKIECFDGLQGIMLYHSIRRGFGQGFTFDILELLLNDLEKVTKATISIMLSISLYNPQQLSHKIQYLHSNIQKNMLIYLQYQKNSAQYKVANEQLDIDYLNYSINRMIAQMISSVTQSSRFNGQRFIDLIEMRECYSRS